MWSIEKPRPVRQVRRPEYGCMAAAGAGSPEPVRGAARLFPAGGGYTAPINDEDIKKGLPTI